MRKIIAGILLLVLLIPVKAFSQRPNVVIILLDDAHRNSIPPLGPDFLDYPSISRIYNEGVTFCNAYTPQPLCCPSRYSMFTGLYPHSHGITSNETLPPPDLQTFWTITQAAGYHNQYVGKYSNVQDSAILGLEKSLLIAKVDQKDPMMYRNDQKVFLTGSTTVIIDDTAAAWLATIDTPFIMCVGHIGTHIPLAVVDEFKHTYDGMGQMPDNFYAYSHDYPSFLYSDTTHYYTDSMTLLINLEKHYEVMQEIDRGVGNFLNELETRGLLENTMVVFTNDNGLLYGEHLLLGKMDPREPTATLPLFIRYPAWFPAGEQVCNNYVSLFDLCPTILDATGIDPAPYHFQGTSIKQLVQPGNERTSFYYEGIRVIDSAGAPPDYAPSWRAVVNQQYKYIRYSCDTLVEELFDMQSDPEENSNVVYSFPYEDVLAQMRHLMDSLAVVTNDTIAGDTLTLPCYMAESTYTQVQNEMIDELGEMVVYPNPASYSTHVFLPFGSRAKNVMLDVFDETGQIVLRKVLDSNSSHVVLDISQWPSGLYFIQSAYNDWRETCTFQVIR